MKMVNLIMACVLSVAVVLSGSMLALQGITVKAGEGYSPAEWFVFNESNGTILGAVGGAASMQGRFTSIPSEINGVAVERINQFAFAIMQGDERINTVVVLPSSINYVGNLAFSLWHSIARIYIDLPEGSDANWHDDWNITSRIFEDFVLVETVRATVIWNDNPEHPNYLSGVNTGYLNLLIEAIDNLEQGNVPDDIWNELKEELQRAITLLEGTPTQEQVDAVFNDLNKAYMNVVNFVEASNRTNTWLWALIASGSLLGLLILLMLFRRSRDKKVDN